jgi:hypothetical protein
VQTGAWSGSAQDCIAVVGSWQRFGVSDTAFRIFILMASRRLKSDRFFTNDFRPEVYTQIGYDWVNNTSMKEVLLRHYPELDSVIGDAERVFAPWPRLGAPVPGKKNPIEQLADSVRAPTSPGGNDCD